MKTGTGKEESLEKKLRRLATFYKPIKPTVKDWVSLAYENIRDILKLELSYALPHKGTIADDLTSKVRQFANYAHTEISGTAHTYRLMFQHPKESKHALGELVKDLSMLPYKSLGYMFPYSADYSVDQRISHALIGSNIAGIALGGLVTGSVNNPLGQIALSSATCEAIAIGGFIISFPFLTEATNLWRRTVYGKRISGNKAPETLDRLKRIHAYMKNVGAAATVSFVTETALISFMAYAPKAVSAGISYLTGMPLDFELPIGYVTVAGLTASSALFIVTSKVSTYNLNNHIEHHENAVPKTEKAGGIREYAAKKARSIRSYVNNVRDDLAFKICIDVEYIATTVTDGLNAIKKHTPLNRR